MTFLELCRRVGSRSGTVSSGQPLATTAGASGRWAKIVGYTADAWSDIQTARRDWLFMQGEFSGPIAAGQPRYSYGAFGIARFAGWVRDRPSLAAMSLRETALGLADDAALTELPHDDWRELFGRGAQRPGRPVYWAVSPSGELLLGPVPDRAFTLTGGYRKAPQLLELDDDVPDLPAHFADVIAAKALLLLAEHDQRPGDIIVSRSAYANKFSQLVTDQTGRVELS